MMQGTQKSPGELPLDQGNPQGLHITGTTTAEDYEPNYSISSRVDQDIKLYKTAYARGYAAGLREGLAQGPAHPAVQQSVANFFGEWDGAEAARARSTARFWEQYNQNQERDAA